MAKPLVKSFDTCPMLARSDWGVGHIQQRGLTHALSVGQSPVGFHGPRVAGWLVFLNGSHRGEDMRLPVGETKIGSSWLNDHVITGVGIGSQHALIKMGIGEGTITPTSPDKVIKINNLDIFGPQTLVDGCLISMGELHCIYRNSEQATRGYQPKESPKPLNMPTQAVLRETCCGWLVISKGSYLGQDFRLVNGDVRLGSSIGLEITIPDPHLPPHALTFSVSTKDCKLKWIHSKSKIFVNGAEGVEEMSLKESDKISLDHIEGYLKWFRP